MSIEGLGEVKRWLANIDSRAATQKALSIPNEFRAFFGEGDVENGIKENASKFKKN